MRTVFYLMSALLLFGPLPLASAETVRRLADESPQAFSKRVGPAEIESLHVVQTKDWIAGRTAIVAFYPQEGKPDRSDPVIGYLYLEQEKGIYQRILIGTLPEEGGDPEIKAVAFANADSDPVAELIVLVSWPVQHYDVSGTLYSTYVYDFSGLEEPKLNFLKDISNKLDGGCDCTWREGKTNSVKLKTVAAIKARLHELGY